MNQPVIVEFRTQPAIGNGGVHVPAVVLARVGVPHGAPLPAEGQTLRLRTEGEGGERELRVSKTYWGVWRSSDNPSGWYCLLEYICEVWP